MLLERESSALKQVSHLKILVQTKRNPCYPVIFNLFKFGEFLFLMSMLDMGFFRWFCEGGAGGYHVITFQHQKHTPFSVHCFCSVGVSLRILTASTMAQKTALMFACFVLNTPNTDNP